MSLYLVLAESSLELVPEEIASHPAVRRHAKKKGKKPVEILLDRSYHHRAILELDDQERRGRPDITYHVLLDVTSTPLYREGAIGFFIHTIGDFVIEIGRGVRPPRSYHRFEGLFEKLFKEREIRSEAGEVLLRLKKESFEDFVARLSPEVVIGFSRIGRFKPLQDIVAEALSSGKALFVIGGFPRGHFSDKVSKFLDRVYSIHKMGLDSTTVVCRLLYELEKSLKLSL